MSSVPKFDEAVLKRICEVLANTRTGLSNTEIDDILGKHRIPSTPGASKRVRLFEALKNRQDRDGVGNLVVAFIHDAMNPVRYTGTSEYFETKRDELNQVLAFGGYFLGDDGKLKLKDPVKTLPEAERQASRLRAELQRGGVHPSILPFCRAELLQKNYFHAVLEATKSLAERIRQMTGLGVDGPKLVDEAVGFRNAIPYLAFNTLQTQTEQSIQSGLMDLMKGMFGIFRHPTAHAPKIKWDITEQDFLELLSILSLLHRHLDGAHRTPRQAPQRETI